MIYSTFISEKIHAKLREWRMSWRDGIFSHQEGRAVNMCADLTFQTLFPVANLEAGGGFRSALVQGGGEWAIPWWTIKQGLLHRSTHRTVSESEESSGVSYKPNPGWYELLQEWQGLGARSWNQSSLLQERMRDRQIVLMKSRMKNTERMRKECSRKQIREEENNENCPYIRMSTNTWTQRK